MTVKAAIFDAYGTLFDVYSVATLARELFGERGARLAELWRDKQIEYTRLRTLCDRYAPFSEVTADALRFCLARLGIAARAGDIERLLGQYDRLEVFPENRAVLARLAERGVPLAILSNGDAGMLARILANTGLADVFAHVLSADTVRRFKTAPEVYALGPATFGVPASELVFVSSNGWDVCGATWYGYRTFWINRLGQPAEELGVAPLGQGPDMNALLPFIDA